ncbi:hypothetical protein [Streptomyces sp. NPDC048496]|uniref:hypothetical protein n=1 Tax=Streptomyces sp. NPDC048496 TaxID=3365558 RepID=UPI00372486AF
MLGPFLLVFADGSPESGVAAVVDRMTAWAGVDAAVAGWVAAYVPAAVGNAGMPGRAPAGAVLAGAQLHGSVGLEAAGLFADMRHTGATLPAVQAEMPADAVALV